MEHRTRYRQVSRSAQQTVGVCLCLWLAVARASAQDAGLEDGGFAGPEDAGVERPDAGFGQPMDGGTRDGGMSVPIVACSCETKMGVARQQTQIHVCTGSYEPEVCERFTCSEPGMLTNRRCPSQDRVRLCCSMPERDLYSHLYDDCTHPNCETGFRVQCEDFDGIVSEGPCPQPDGMDNGGWNGPSVPADDDDLGGCSVADPGRAASGLGLLALLGLATGLALRRRSARKDSLVSRAKRSGRASGR